ncbi:sensor histidine kinase [Diplocloster hominis]|uniref:sensor histidine kinase n=1 Tax=Diplocloster hominis TaxID=3079010 RepID=UPI0031BA0D73
MYIKFKYKLMLVLCAILAIAVTITSAIWYTNSRSMVVETMFQSMNVLLDERARELESLLKNISSQTRTLTYNNSTVDRYIHNRWENEYLNNQARNKLDENINSIYVNNTVIQSIAIGNFKGDLVYRGNKFDYAFVKENRLDEMLPPDSSDVLVFAHGDSSYSPEDIMLYRNILYYGKRIGFCLVNLNRTDINDIFDDVFPGSTAIRVRTKGDSYLYTSSGYAAVEKSPEMSAQFDDIEKDREDSHRIIRDGDNSEWLAMSQQLFADEIAITIAIPMDNLLSDIRSKFQNIFVITLLMMGIMLCVISILSRWISRNVDSLTTALQNFSGGTLDTKVELNSRDEFGKVAEAFNLMTGDIRQLMEDIKTKEKEKTALEIRSLQGQINMHFLFNTLNTIKNLCYVQRVTNVERLVNALMDLLHVSMENGNDYVTLQTELDYINDYLEIYKYKSVLPVSCYMDIEPGLENARILKFMIQPIVENAIIHGIEENDDSEEGLIYIKAARIDEIIEIDVIDNGQGFDTSRISTFNGIGLSNTDQRIKIHFGDEYGIEVESTVGVSTVVKVRIPYKEWEE